MSVGIHEIPAKQWMLSQRNTSFLGTRVLQRWVDFPVWEKLLNKYDELRTIIELGTWNGAFSTYLLLQALQREMMFYTFDSLSHSEVREKPVAVRLQLFHRFYHMNVFEEGLSMIEDLLSESSMHPLILFCDNGDKPREFETFVPLLSTGDIVGVHDWTEEFGPLDVACMKHLLTPVFHEECETVNSITRFWQRV